jgi:hypothetical protein
MAARLLLMAALLWTAPSLATTCSESSRSLSPEEIATRADRIFQDTDVPANVIRNMVVRVETPGGDNPLTMRLSVGGDLRRGVPVPIVSLNARRGTPPYAFSIVSGFSLPPGLTLNSGTGRITGTPTTIGHYTFVAEVQDSLAQSFQHAFSLDVIGRLFPVNVTPVDGMILYPYLYQFRVSNNTGPVTWTLDSGTLPAGLSLSTDGTISGFPVNPDGVSYFQVTATDAGSGDTYTVSTSINIHPIFQAVGTLNLHVQATVPFAIPVPPLFEDGVPPITYRANIDPGYLWLRYNPATQQLEGTASEFDVGSTIGANITGRDSLGFSDVAVINITVDPAPNSKIQPQENGVDVGTIGPIAYDFIDGANTTAHVTNDGTTVTVSYDVAGGSTVTLGRYEFEFLNESPGAERYDYLPANFQVTGYVLLAQPSGSCVVDLWVDGYSAFPPTVGDSICAAAKPTISSGVKAKDSTLTGWTRLLTADSTITAHLDSLTTSTNVKLVLFGFQPNQTITSVVLSGTLGNGSVGVPYSESLAITGGIPPYVNPLFSVTLPAGLSAAVVGTDVVVSGTPTVGGAYSATATVQDAFAQTSNSLPVSFSVAYATLVITGTFGNTTIGNPMTGSLTISGGDGSYTLGTTTGTLPPGSVLTLAGSSITDTGATTTAATDSFTVHVTSGDGQSASSPQTVTVSTASLGPIGSKMTSFWDMDEAAGVDRLDSVSGNTAFDVVGNVGTNTGPKGGLDVAAEFVRASSKYLNAGNVTSNRIDVSTKATGGAHAWFGWVYTNNNAVTQNVIAIWDSATAAGCMYLMQVFAGDFYGYNGGSSFVYGSTGIGSAGWHFVYMERDFTTGNVSVSIDNGSLVSTAAGPSNPNPALTDYLYFGVANSAGQPLDGRLSRIGWIKGDTLTSGERTQLYNGGPSGALSWADIVAGGL